MLRIPFDNKQKSIYLLLIALFTFGWLIKTLIFIREMEMEPHILLLLLSSLSIGLVTVGLLSNHKFTNYMAAIFYILVSCLHYADVVYQRYYHAILRIELVAVAGQLRTVHDSVLSLLTWSDVVYFIDIPILLLILFLIKRPVVKTKRYMLLPGILLLLVISFTSFKFTYSDQYKVSLTGVVPAHVNDVFRTLYDKFYIAETFLKGETLKEVRGALEQKFEEQKSLPEFGKYKGKNLIVVQAESLNTFPVGLKIEGESITPNIDELINTSHYYPNTFLQIGRGNTSDAEFVANNSLYPMSHLGVYKRYPDNHYLSLGNVLKENGYSTSATHGNLPEFWNRLAAYDAQGYEEFYHSEHSSIRSDEIIGLGISDESMFTQMIDIYKQEQKPFYNFFVTLTLHRPFILPEQYQYLQLPGHFEDTPTGNYLQSVRYFDEALGIFIEKLKEEGLWDETIFVMYGDHYGPVPSDAEEIYDLTGVVFDKKESFKVPLIIHHPGQTEGELHTSVGSQMDIYPTLSVLLGINQPLIQLGTSLDANKEKIVGFAYETTKYSFYSDDFDYLASHDGVFEHGVCIDNTSNSEIDVSYCREGYDKVLQDIRLSGTLLKHNFITKIFE
ncbi:LTA synthase family protein [Cytobacillus luteolus]|uniref:LTA synthase family protein n=1 Tax=Litchfieldia luteola TaxID=682179 RepID=UPI001AE52382|nr:LTA synthase family protein [Cytobacillus luteolus]MBP1943342.1 phosphoglycerol transferase MdoB-like AlkP superfamily enzyme [Cytobacillus luteolus]